MRNTMNRDFPVSVTEGPHTGMGAVAAHEKSFGEWVITLSVFVLAALYFGLSYNVIGMNADEGIILQGACAFFDGQVLYRDFFGFFTPGSYYWMALLFKIFGTSILVGRAAFSDLRR